MRDRHFPRLCGNCTPAELEARRMAATERWADEGGSVLPDPAPAELLVEEARVS
jgi:hypothetical protein